MSPPARPDEMRPAMDAVRRASAVCRRIRQDVAPGTLTKEDRSPVTIADFASQAVVCGILGDATPDIPIVAEEDAGELRKPENAALLERIAEEVGAEADEVCARIDLGSGTGREGRFWTLDPIDGTKGFLRGGQYAIALALIEEGRVRMGLLGCPNLSSAGDSGIVMTALRGAGRAQVTSLDHPGDPIEVRVSETSDASDARFCESVESGHSSHGWSAQVAEALGMTAAPLRMDSQAKYATIARGDADIYLRLPTRPGYVEKIWDHAAGVLIVQEAGGVVTDVDGRGLEFSHGQELSHNRGVVVTNGRLHEQVLRAVSRASTG